MTGSGPTEGAASKALADTRRWLLNTDPFTTTAEDVAEYAIERALFHANRVEAGRT